MKDSTAPSLTYTNPAPRIPGTEATPPTQPETFIKRARQVKTGSCTLKIWYLALCTFGRAWVRDTDRLTIRIKRQTLAGELECRLNTIRDRLADLREAGLIETRRSKYHLEIVVFCKPQLVREGAESAPSETSEKGRKAPLQKGRKAPLPMSLGSDHQEEEDQVLRPTTKQTETIRFLWTRVERTGDVPTPTTMAEAALLIEALSDQRKDRTRARGQQHRHLDSQRHSTTLAAARNEVFNDWTPATNPGADLTAVTDWRCSVEQAVRRDNLDVQRRHYIKEGKLAGVTDPEAEIDILISRTA